MVPSYDMNTFYQYYYEVRNPKQWIPRGPMTKWGYFHHRLVPVKAAYMFWVIEVRGSNLPALRRVTWSSRGSSVKCGILLAHSTNVKSCLSAAWHMLVTGSCWGFKHNKSFRINNHSHNYLIFNRHDIWPLGKKVAIFNLVQGLTYMYSEHMV